MLDFFQRKVKEFGMLEKCFQTKLFENTKACFLAMLSMEPYRSKQKLKILNNRLHPMVIQNLHSKSINEKHSTSPSARIQSPQRVCISFNGSEINYASRCIQIYVPQPVSKFRVKYKAVLFEKIFCTFKKANERKLQPSGNPAQRS